MTASPTDGAHRLSQAGAEARCPHHGGELAGRAACSGSPTPCSRRCWPCRSSAAPRWSCSRRVSIPRRSVRQGLRRAVLAVAAALLAHPLALGAFLVAVPSCVLGGSLFMAFVKGGIDCRAARRRAGGRADRTSAAAPGVRAGRVAVPSRSAPPRARSDSSAASRGSAAGSFVAYAAVLGLAARRPSRRAAPARRGTRRGCPASRPA